VAVLGGSDGGERPRTTHCSGARVSLSFIVNLDDLGVVRAPAEFGRSADAR
jgi:hypothetical protein